jgi:hypothetical protein
MPVILTGLVSVLCYCTSLRNFLQHQVSRLHPHRQHFVHFVNSQPSTRAPAATFPHNPSHRVRDRCAPTSMQPHRLVKINFYSINRTRRLGADADQHSLSTSSDVYHVVNLIRSKVFSNRKLLSPCCVANTSHPCGTLATLDFASVKFRPHVFASANFYGWRSDAQNFGTRRSPAGHSV